jgi:hydrogenase/urease accessory protein HupE
MRVRRYTPGLALALVLLSATRAEAHTMVSTAGPFYAGMKHFFFSLDDVLAALAVGLMAGLRKDTPGSGRAALMLPAAWFGLGVVALLLSIALITGEVASAVSLMVLGILVAMDRKLPVGVLGSLAGVAGGLHGFLNGLAMREVGTKAGFWQLVGVAVPAVFFVVYPTALLDLVKRPWVRIVVRVLGSWIAAIGLLLLGWSLRAGR